MTMRKLHVKKGDTVVVLSGKDKGKKGKILTALPQKERVVVEGVNIVKRHTKPTQKVMQGGIIEREAAIHSSNVMLVCSRCGKPTRFGAKQLGDGKVARVCRNCGEVIDK